MLMVYLAIIWLLVRLYTHTYFLFTILSLAEVSNHVTAHLFPL